MKGFETAAMLHQHPGFERTPVILMTAVHVTDFDGLKGCGLGAVDYVYLRVIPEILRGKVQVSVELYLKRRELDRLHQSLKDANARLAHANSLLLVEKSRVLPRSTCTPEDANAGLARANNALHAEVAEGKRAEAALHEVDRRKDEFMAMLSHELRNPLAAITGAVQVMKLKALDDTQLTWTRDVLARQAMHLTRLVENLLDVSRITRGKLTLRREVVDLALVMAQVIETTVPVIRERRRTLSVVLPNQPVLVEGDLVRLTQVIDNLLANAAKYTGDGGHIELVLEADQENQSRYAVIRVRDTGIGIPADMLPRMFDLFTQAECKGNGMQGGLGIGLVVVRGLVEMHGGTIHVHSAGVGRGSEFVVRLPMRNVVSEMPEIVIRPPPDPPPGRLRVLIVDDNEDAARSVGMLLEMEGYEVLLAHAGQSALLEAFEHVPDVVLLDIGLPDMNGYDVARQLREHPQFRTTRLIAMTGYGRYTDRRESEEAAFDHHLVKPVDFEKLHGLLAGRAMNDSSVRTSSPVASY